MQKDKATIPVYDICSFSGNSHIYDYITAEPFAANLAGHPNLHFPHRHSFYQVVLFTKGSGTHTIYFEQFTVAPGQIYFIIPRQVPGWAFEGEKDGYIINLLEGKNSARLSAIKNKVQLPFLRGIAKDSVTALSQVALDSGQT